MQMNKLFFYLVPLLLSLILSLNINHCGMGFFNDDSTDQRQDTSSYWVLGENPLINKSQLVILKIINGKEWQQEKNFTLTRINQDMSYAPGNDSIYLVGEQGYEIFRVKQETVLTASTITQDAGFKRIYLNYNLDYFYFLGNERLWSLKISGNLLSQVALVNYNDFTLLFRNNHQLVWGGHSQGIYLCSLATQVSCVSSSIVAGKSVNKLWIDSSKKDLFATTQTGEILKIDTDKNILENSKLLSTSNSTQSIDGYRDSTTLILFIAAGNNLYFVNGENLSNLQSPLLPFPGIDISNIQVLGQRLFVFGGNKIAIFYFGKPFSNFSEPDLIVSLTSLNPLKILPNYP